MQYVSLFLADQAQGGEAYIGSRDRELRCNEEGEQVDRTLLGKMPAIFILLFALPLSREDRTDYTRSHAYTSLLASCHYSTLNLCSCEHVNGNKNN